VRVIEETLTPGEIPLWRNPDWDARFPWLQQGTTGRGKAEDLCDFGLFGDVHVRAAVDRWRDLRAALRMPVAIHSRQVHGAEVAEWRDAVPSALVVTEGFDAHFTRLPGILLTVSTADCVPVFLVSENPRVIAMIHAGWRGTAASIVERTIEHIVHAGTDPGKIWMHCGPSICGECYEVGPEVHAGVHPGSEPPPAPRPIDLRRALFERAVVTGLAAERISISAHCTLCGPGAFHSHRGGSPARQLGVLGLLE
jgi:polyphenol oxidase